METNDILFKNNGSKNNQENIQSITLPPCHCFLAYIYI